MFDLAKFNRCRESPLENMFKDSFIEKLNIRLCKFLLGVSRKASNLAVMGELGRYPFYIDVIVTMLKYWLRLHNLDSSKDKLLCETLKENYSMFENGEHCWLNCIYLILKELKMLNLFHNPQSFTNRIMFTVKKELQCRFERKWKTDINFSKSRTDPTSGNKLRTYASFKSRFSCEAYTKLNNFQERRILSQFRISTHRLEIQKGRYTMPKTPVGNRICKQCDRGLIEDELHFLLVCPKYDLFRDAHIIKKISNVNFHNLSTENKFIWLMSNEDLSLCKAVSTYLINSFNVRNSIAVT